MQQLRQLARIYLVILAAAGIEVGRAYIEVEGYQPRPFRSEVGSHFHPASRFPKPPYNAVRPDFPGTV